MQGDMDRTVVGLFDNTAAAQRAHDDVVRSGGCPREDIDLIRGDQPGTDISNLDRELTAEGVPENHARIYAEGVRRGRALVTVDTNEAKAAEIAAILDRNGAWKLQRIASELRQAGWTGMGTTTTRPAAATPKAGRTGDIHESVIEEELLVGKREIEVGGVRVYARVTETPVSKQVELREEHVEVERRPADRPATPADLKAGEQTIEMRETREEPVVGKRARVKEDVVVRKDVHERQETVEDTVRRRDVEVEKMHGRDFGRFEDEFRANYNTAYGTTGATYEQYAPAYRWGYELANQREYAGRDWKAVEPEARRRWEERNPGTWERFKDAIAHAFSRSGRT